MHGLLVGRSRQSRKVEPLQTVHNLRLINVRLVPTSILSRDRVANTERIVNSLAARVTWEANATSVSNGSGPASSWNVLGHNDGSNATGSLGFHGPGSSDDNRNTRRRLDTFSNPEDEHARSAVLFQFTCEQYHAGVSVWFDFLGNIQRMFQQAYQNTLQNRFSFCQTRIWNKRNVMTLWPGTRMMVSLTQLIVRFAVLIPVSLSANPSHLRNAKLEDGLHHFGGLSPPRSKKPSLDEMLSRHLTTIHKYSASWIAGVGLENQFSNLHLLSGGFNICDQKKVVLTSGIRPSPTATRERRLSSAPFFPHHLEIAQRDFTRRDSPTDGIVRTLSRIDRTFINLPMAEARDFHCYSHVFRKPWGTAHTEWSCSCTRRQQKPTVRGSARQTFSELDVWTSHLLLHAETGGWRPSISWWSVRRYCWL